MQSDASTLFREYLATSNLDGIRRLWLHLYPGMPQPAGDFEVQVVMHLARTQAETIPLKLRLYSHQWLLANGQPSQLPDMLRPMAERVGGTFSRGVGIAVLTDDPAGIADPALRAAAEQKQRIGKMLQEAMGAAVKDAFASGRTDAGFLRQRMDEARSGVLRRSGGPQVKVAVTHNFAGLNVR